MNIKKRESKEIEKICNDIVKDLAKEFDITYEQAEDLFESYAGYKLSKME